eukprot:snap_masked-scaffold_91-processed-gene-0.18-mRNA-1 protein AED:1.00 eAED:1.00 QI:0/-1/0/0/-1/1/1/0/341
MPEMQLNGNNNRHSSVRSLLILIDITVNMENTDIFRPSCLAATVNQLQTFIPKFLHENTLSSLGLITIRNGKAQLISKITSDAETHIANLNSYKFISGVDFSLQNGLELALTLFQTLPNFYSKEVLSIQASLTSSDPFDIFQTVTKLQENNVSVSFISLTAEVYICRFISAQTKGEYKVTKYPIDLETELENKIRPKRSTIENDKIIEDIPVLMKTGFLKNVKGGPERFGFSYECSVCGSLLEVNEEVSALECYICETRLLKSSILAKSFQQLYSKQEYVLVEDIDGFSACSACFRKITTSDADGQKEGGAFSCKNCQQVYCGDCKALLETSFFDCPRCVA